MNSYVTFFLQHPKRYPQSAKPHYRRLIGQKQEGLSRFVGRAAVRQTGTGMRSDVGSRLAEYGGSGGRNRDVHEAGSKSRFSLNRVILPPSGGG